jgi:hypothetical protein
VRSSLAVRVGAAEGTDLIVHLLEQSPDLLMVAADPGMELPLLDGFRTS